MFEQLMRGREDLFKDLTPAVFESACRKHFILLRKVELQKGRRDLYLMRKKGARIEG
jgi:hypothetical protein